MTRPAVVVGLGGTGQWVLTYLKREMLITGQGTMPSSLRFLAFDTMPQPEAVVRTTQSSRDERVTVGSVQLTGEEFVHIGGNAYNISDKLIKDDPEYAHIAKWFRYRDWRSILPAAAWNLDDGAGRIRQLGRLATFKDLLNLQAGSRVWKALKRAIDDVKSQGQISENQPLELILVGSFAGGTGSGCFLDVAVLLRHLARGVPHSLRGYFVLPTAFNSEPTNEMKARSYAAWRELNRFMLINPDFPIRIDYSSEDTQFQVVLDKRLFDVCYLVDGYRVGNPLNTDPKYSVFPTITEAITTLLDEAGTEYVRTILTNLLPVYQQRRSTPLYSGLGSYSFKIPAYYLQQEASHQCSLDVLGALLGLPQSSDPKLIRANLQRVLTLVDQNLERGVGFPGRREVDSFLALTSLRYGDLTVKPTTFTSKIGFVVREGAERNPKLVDEYVVSVLRTNRTARVEDPSWLASFTNLGDDPANERVRQEVATELGLDVVQIFGKRQGDNPQQAIKRQEEIKKFVFEHYGGDLSSGEVYGLFGEALAKCQDFHTDLFRSLVRVWTLNTLMGNSTDDAIKARGGKLVYAYDFFDGLVDALERARLFMQAVQAGREAQHQRLKMEGLAENARRIAQDTANRKFLWIFDHPRFEQDLNTFLSITKRLIDLRKEELLHQYVTRTLEAMQRIAQNARSELERWIWHLATGDRASATIGLYQELLRNLEMAQANHGVDRLLSGDPSSEHPGIQQLLRDEQIAVTDVAELQRMLARLEWSAELRGANHEELSLQANFRPVNEGEPTQILINPSTARTDQQREHFSDQNIATLLDLSTRTSTRLLQTSQIAPTLMSIYPDPQRLAEDILSRRAEPLIHVHLRDAPKRSAIIRVGHMQSEATRTYFQTVEDRLRAANQVGNQDDTFFIRVISTDNPYTCSMVRTDELYRYDRFSAWEQCKEGFHKYVYTENQDPTLIHNFAAEANAARLERQLATAGQSHKSLHPWVVMLLEEEHRFRHAAFCILTGRFVPTEAGENIVWKLQLPLSRGGVREIVLSPAGKKEDDTLFQALYNFVIRGQDIRPDYGQLRVWPIRTEEPNLVVQAVRRTQEEWGRQREISEWRSMLDREDPNTFLAWLRRCAVDNQGNAARPEFDDLATVIEVLLTARIEELGEDGAPDSSMPAQPLASTAKWKTAQ